MRPIRNSFTILMVLPFFCGSVIGLCGCEQKEKVIDIDTPAGKIEVERSKNSGKVEIDVKVNHK